MSTHQETLSPERELAVQDMLLAVRSGKSKKAAESLLRVVNPILDALPPTNDLQSEVIERHKRELDAMVEPFMEHPEESIRAEFELLRMLSGQRSNTDTYLGTGTVETEFVTRNDTRDAIDHHFRILEFTSGKEWFVDQTTFSGRRPLTTIMLQDGELVIEQQQYLGKRGRTQVPIDHQSEDGREILQDFFKDTIYAAHLIYTRTPEESDEADKSAKRLLVEKKAWKD